MSADHYAICPRCVDEARKTIGLLYICEEDYRTFREDYEFWGADSGTVNVHYRGECDKCGLACKFDEPHVFYEREGVAA